MKKSQVLIGQPGSYAQDGLSKTLAGSRLRGDHPSISPKAVFWLASGSPTIRPQGFAETQDSPV